MTTGKHMKATDLFFAYHYLCDSLWIKQSFELIQVKFFFVDEFV